MPENLFADYLGNFRVMLDDQFFIERYIIEQKVWDPISVALIRYFVRPGDFCIDIGANAGFVSLAMAQAALPGGKVLAFEPNTLTFARLQRNINLNLGLDRTISAIRLGLGATKKTLNIYNAGGHGNAYLADRSIERLSGSNDLPADDVCDIVRLDDYLKEHGMEHRPIKLLKLDVEGMELEVLRGAEHTLFQHHPIILYETLLEYFEPQQILDIEGFLREREYVILGVTHSLRLRGTSFPDYGENTVAIWRPEIVKFLDVIHNASKYKLEFDGHSLSAKRARELFDTILVACIEPQVIHLALNHDESDNKISACETGIAEGKQFEVGFPDEPWLSKWSVWFTSTDLSALQGKIILPQGEVTFRATKVAGYLEHL